MGYGNNNDDRWRPSTVPSRARRSFSGSSENDRNTAASEETRGSFQQTGNDPRIEVSDNTADTYRDRNIASAQSITISRKKSRPAGSINEAYGQSGASEPRHYNSEESTVPNRSRQANEYRREVSEQRDNSASIEDSRISSIPKRGRFSETPTARQGGEGKVSLKKQSRRMSDAVPHKSVNTTHDANAGTERQFYRYEEKDQVTERIPDPVQASTEKTMPVTRNTAKENQGMQQSAGTGSSYPQNTMPVAGAENNSQMQWQQMPNLMNMPFQNMSYQQVAMMWAYCQQWFAAMQMNAQQMQYPAAPMQPGNYAQQMQYPAAPMQPGNYAQQMQYPAAPMQPGNYVQQMQYPAAPVQPDNSAQQMQYPAAPVQSGNSAQQMQYPAAPVQPDNSAQQMQYPAAPVQPDNSAQQMQYPNAQMQQNSYAKNENEGQNGKKRMSNPDEAMTDDEFFDPNRILNG